MSGTLNYVAYNGIWVNWSYGSVLGATITLPQSQATLLIAFVAFFTTIIGTSLWRILCFALYHTFSTPTTPRDAMYHQQQAILRNAQSPLLGFKLFSNLAWAWRKDGQRTCFRIVPILAGALTLAIGLAVASGFSSAVARDNEILIMGKDCHWTTSTFHAGNAIVQQNDLVYARDCYALPLLTASKSLGCNSYIRRTLSYSVNRTATCPFESSICKSQDRNIELDTGYLDSLEDLGWNGPPSQRMKYRTTLHCAPLVTDNYTNVHNTSATRSNTQYFYGQDIADGNDFTYEASNDAYAETKADGSLAIADYTLNACRNSRIWAPYANGSVVSDIWGWLPIPQLDVPDSTLSLIVLQANSVLYEGGPVSDLWYEATDPKSKIRYYSDNSTSTLYGANTPASPLACVSREQYCKVGSDTGTQCTELTGFFDLQESAKKVFTDEESWNTFQWYASNIFDAPAMLLDIVGTRELSLIARAWIQDGIQRGITDEQWQGDVEYWFASILAALQRAPGDAARGTDVDPGDLKWLHTPNNTEEQSLCSSQKALSPYHTSFSVFGLLFIFVLGMISIILSLSLESLTSLVRRHRKLNQDTCLEWNLNETLQLQRLVHEEIGIGAWSSCTKTIPLIRGDARLGTLDTSKPDHPRIVSDVSSGEDAGDTASSYNSEITPSGQEATEPISSR
ncbi:hypothetical protein PFICI_11071 [Pestalotiopsis fici W106-1]|uniref:Uncharacterized protein n=1 Tax=Pestalotiopsis fici (strain W106-1 / CGMCC3.15140) TaxID=1229662 RepID=W3WVP2_PESFW|nr:uncharacterized protein PFICI_11071 [Pestalotiopsis fici W106-1]ETS77197.1 hypothetical protein PFICI_11071 [Pestalotiopsis fici W106-1]